MTHLHLFALFVMQLFVETLCQADVRRPPNIISPARDDILYYSGNINVALNCISDGQPPATYKWKKNDQDIVPDAITSYDSTTGTLTINGFSKREEGIYMCVATNTFNDGAGGTITAANFSPRQNLKQTRIGSFIVKQDTTTEALQQDYFKLLCDNKGEIVAPYVIINWYDKQGKVISLDADRLYIDTNGNLHFSYVKDTDRSVNFYSCGILYQDEKQITLGPFTKLEVRSNTNTLAIKPQLRFSNTDVTGIRFGEAKLECMFSTYDPGLGYTPITSWYDDTNHLLGANDKFGLSNAGRTLTIKNLLEEDEKKYRCEMKNTAGDAQGIVFLNVTSRPIFINGVPSNQTVSENADAVFDCSTRSASTEIPPGPPTWFINGVPFGTQNDPNKFQMSGDKKILTVKNVKKATDIMCVQCNVSNSVDSVMVSMCLNVIMPIQVQTPKTLQAIRYGDSVDLTITASTDPSLSLNYKWEFDNKTYVGNEHPPFMYFNPITMLAYINTSSLNQEQYGLIGGVYRRVIYHYYETVNVDIEVVLADRQVGTAGATFDLWIIGLIIGLLLLIIIILLIIFIVCRKKQEGDYNVDKKETGAGLDPEKELKDGGFNAYSRPVYDDIDGYLDKKPSAGDPEYDDAPIGGDDESLGEYGKDIYTHFNEDGSFIGVYQSKIPAPVEPAESTI